MTVAAVVLDLDLDLTADFDFGGLEGLPVIRIRHI
jgi:hypothetical protein